MSEKYGCYSNGNLLVAVLRQPGETTTITNTPGMAVHDGKRKIREVR